LLKAVSDHFFLPPFSTFFGLQGDEDDHSPISINTVRSDNPATTSGILRSKDLRSVVEIKRRNFSRGGSSSDSEDAGSNYDMNHLSNRKQTRSPSSMQEPDSNDYPRGRSLSNVEHVVKESPSTNTPQQITTTSSNDHLKRKSFSRTSSSLSTNRLTLVNNTDESNSETLGTNSSIITGDRTRSLSVDHRLANQSQFSIASRASIRYSTPRESTVFTKTDVPMIVRLIQQAPHQDPADAIKTIIEHQRSQSFSAPQENLQTPVILEEDTSSPTTATKSNRSLKSPLMKKISNTAAKSNTIAPTIEPVNVSDAHAPSEHSVLSTLKHSLIKHQQQRKPLANDAATKIEKKTRHSTSRHRACCTVS
jgi:hypothetical protein